MTLWIKSVSGSLRENTWGKSHNTLAVATTSYLLNYYYTFADVFLPQFICQKGNN